MFLLYLIKCDMAALSILRGLCHQGSGGALLPCPLFQHLRGWSSQGCDFSGMGAQVTFRMGVHSVLRKAHSVSKILEGVLDL